ncbi:unnamed protein product, partial [Rotaria sp. Silwood2]
MNVINFRNHNINRCEASTIRRITTTRYE